jgi:hypothetical protein
MIEAGASNHSETYRTTVTANGIFCVVDPLLAADTVTE